MPSKNLHIISKKIVATPHGAGPITGNPAGIGEWAVWVNHDEEGAGDTSDIPSAGDIDLDNDGVYGTRFRAVIDLSHGLGFTLGKQLPMTAVYRVKGLRLSLRPVDDAVDNSQGGVIFGGQIKWLPPNRHCIDAIQAARDVDHLAESIDIDTDSDLFGTASKDYTGFRFGFRTETDVAYATREGFTAGAATEGGTASWCLFGDDGALGIVDNYNAWKALTPTQGQNRALWNKRVGHTSSMKWASTWVSDTGAQSHPDWDWQAGAGNHLDVVGGLLIVDVQYSSTDGPGETDDDYTLQVGVEVEGWEEF